MLRICINTPAGPTDQRLHVSEKVLQYTLVSTSNRLCYRVIFKKILIIWILQGHLWEQMRLCCSSPVKVHLTLFFKLVTNLIWAFLISDWVQCLGFSPSSLLILLQSFLNLQFKYSHCKTSQQIKPILVYTLCSITSVLIYISRFCLSETSCPQEDHFPPNLCVKVNSKPCNLPVSPGTLLWFSFFLHVLPVAQNHKWCALDCVCRDICLQLRMELNQKGPAAPSTSPLSSDCPPPSPTQLWCRGPQKSGGYENRRSIFVLLHDELWYMQDACWYHVGHPILR